MNSTSSTGVAGRSGEAVADHCGGGRRAGPGPGRRGRAEPLEQPAFRAWAAAELDQDRPVINRDRRQVAIGRLPRGPPPTTTLSSVGPKVTTDGAGAPPGIRASPWRTTGGSEGYHEF